MIRLFLTLGLILLLIVALLAGAARGIGQRLPAHHFPLPTQDGCWQGVCLFNLPTADIIAGLSQAVEARPLTGPRGGGYALVLELVYTPSSRSPRPALLYWSPQSYNLTRDHRLPGNPPLLRAGDLIAALGPPAQVVLLENQVVLSYPQGWLDATLIPARWQADRWWLSPDDGVSALFVRSPSLWRSTTSEATYYPPTRPWHGFGLYQLTG